MSRAATLIAIAVVDWNERVLIGPRPPGKPLAGLWEFPGGKVAPGESPSEAALRECREETGVSITVLDTLARIEHEYPHDRVELHFFDCRPSDPQPWPQPPFRWVLRRELGKFKFPEANRLVIERLVQR
jgi:mutator protein MutT